MESTTIEIGTRKLQKIGGAHVLTIPIIVIRTMRLKTGDPMKCSLDGNVLKIERSQKED